tara:strand:+ start:327 stop:869 length:543 start_codon:yes stop_codon:yes gene_type:complete
MSNFQFAEDDVLTVEVQLRLIMTETGADGRMQRYGDGKDASLLDKNAAVLANGVYIVLGIHDDKMGDMCMYSNLAVLASGSVDGRAASYSQQVAKNNGEQTKDTVLFSVKGSSTMEVKRIIGRANQRAGGITDGDTAIIRLKTMIRRAILRAGGQQPVPPYNARSLICNGQFTLAASDLM